MPSSPTQPHTVPWLVLATAIAVAPGCGGASATPATEPGPASTAAATPAAAPEQQLAGVYRVTIVSAEVEGLMPNGEQWDDRSERGLARRDGPLHTYIERHPELRDTADTIGVPIGAPSLAEQAHDSAAPDPMVVVQIGGATYRSPMRPGAFQPLWQFSFVVTVGDVGGRAGARLTDTAQLHVLDWDGATAFDNLGTAVVTVADLVAERVHRLGPFGSTRTLTVEVERLAHAPDPTELRLAVAGAATWTDTGLDLLAGQRVTIDAAGEMCTKHSDLSKCSGPEGQRGTERSRHNVTGFERHRHGALIGAIGDTRFLVDRERRLIAPSSGRLLLGVNDDDTDNNRGAYDTRIRIDPVP